MRAVLRISKFEAYTIVASGGKPPFLTCGLGPVESNESTGANSQVRKSGLPRSSLTDFKILVFATSLPALSVEDVTGS